jgi:hypothetical protein
MLVSSEKLQRLFAKVKQIREHMRAYCIAGYRSPIEHLKSLIKYARTTSERRRYTNLLAVMRKRVDDIK